MKKIILTNLVINSETPDLDYFVMVRNGNLENSGIHDSQQKNLRVPIDRYPYALYPPTTRQQHIVDYPEQYADRTFWQFANDDDGSAVAGKGMEHYEKELDDDGNLTLTLRNDKHNRFISAQVHQAPAHAMLDGMMAHYVNLKKVLDKITDALVAAQTGFASAASGNTAGIISAANNMDTVIAAIQKIDMGAGKEWLQCVNMRYALHKIVIGVLDGVQDTPLNHARSDTIGELVTGLYFVRRLTVGEDGLERDDTHWVDNGLLEKLQRLPTETPSDQRQRGINRVLHYFNAYYEHSEARFEGSELTPQGIAYIYGLVASVDDTREIPVIEEEEDTPPPPPPPPPPPNPPSDTPPTEQGAPTIQQARTPPPIPNVPETPRTQPPNPPTEQRAQTEEERQAEIRQQDAERAEHVRRRREQQEQGGE